MEPGRIFSTRPVNFKSTPVDRPVDWFFTEGFCSLFNACNKKFSKTAGEGMGEVIKFVTPYGSQKNALKNFCVFYKNNSILRPFSINFRFEIPVLSSAKHAQNKHKKNRKAQAKLLDAHSNDIMRKAKKRIFLAIGGRYFAICRAAITKLL